jgi:hypothetical protein
VKVLDFGIARLLDDNLARVTRVGVPLGTPAYMAPEQARGLGRDVDGRADVYAIGATIFRVLTGRHVHVGQGAAQIAMVAMQRAPRLSSVAPQLSRNVCALIDHALELEPADRYANAREMQGDVRLVRAGAAPAHAPLDPEPRRDAPVTLSPLTPKKLGVPRPKQLNDSVTRLADQARQKAHALAKRPDAFTVHGTSIPASLPTSATASDSFSASATFEAVSPIFRANDRSDPGSDDENMLTVTSQMPMVFGVHEPSTLDPTPPAPVSDRQGQAAIFARSPNVPIPTPAHLASGRGPMLEEATTDPGALIGRPTSPEIDVAAISMDARAIESIRSREVALRQTERPTTPAMSQRATRPAQAPVMTPMSQRPTSTAPPPTARMLAAVADDPPQAPRVGAVMPMSNTPTPVMPQAPMQAARPSIAAIVGAILALILAGFIGALVAKTFGLLR